MFFCSYKIEYFSVFKYATFIKVKDEPSSASVYFQMRQKILFNHQLIQVNTNRKSQVYKEKGEAEMCKLPNIIIINALHLSNVSLFYTHLCTPGLWTRTLSTSVYVRYTRVLNGTNNQNLLNANLIILCITAHTGELTLDTTYIQYNFKGISWMIRTSTAPSADKGSCDMI